jgi:hypothetical protein
MPFAEKKSCSLDGKKLTHGEQACVSDKCMTCDDGNWDDDFDLFVL